MLFWIIHEVKLFKGIQAVNELVELTAEQTASALSEQLAENLDLTTKLRAAIQRQTATA